MDWITKVAQKIYDEGLDSSPGVIEEAIREGAPPNKQAELVSLLIQLRTGDCWCGKGIGNPNYSDHSKVCKDARVLLKDI